MSIKRSFCKNLTKPNKRCARLILFINTPLPARLHSYVDLRFIRSFTHSRRYNHSLGPFCCCCKTATKRHVYQKRGFSLEISARPFCFCRFCCCLFFFAAVAAAPNQEATQRPCIVPVIANQLLLPRNRHVLSSNDVMINKRRPRPLRRSGQSARVFPAFDVGAGQWEAAWPNTSRSAPGGEQPERVCSMASGCSVSGTEN